LDKNHIILGGGCRAGCDPHLPFADQWGGHDLTEIEVEVKLDLLCLF
jgi:hypothetical protein